MKLFYCYTPAHEILVRNYFLPSIPAAFSVLSAKLAIEGSGDFLSAEFLRCIYQKIELIVESISANYGEVIVWSDIDIQFFDLHPDKLLSELGGHSIVFQREGHKLADVNTGFFVCRCSEQTYRFFLRVRERLQENPLTNEQQVINQLLKESTLDLSWTCFPFAYYARTHGWPPPRELVLYHANATEGANGVAKKLKQFKDLDFLRRYRILALITTSLKYAPKRICRWLRTNLTM